MKNYFGSSQFTSMAISLAIVAFALVFGFETPMQKILIRDASHHSSSFDNKDHAGDHAHDHRHADGTTHCHGRVHVACTSFDHLLGRVVEIPYPSALSLDVNLALSLLDSIVASDFLRDIFRPPIRA